MCSTIRPTPTSKERYQFDMNDAYDELPSLAPYRRHVLLCAGKNCVEGMRLLQYLKRRIQEEGLHTGANAVRANRAGCLGVCTQGPIMVVHPDGIWYARLDESVIDRIIDAHFLRDAPLREYCFHAKGVAEDAEA